jgi:microcystin degradation protein MlrC
MAALASAQNRRPRIAIAGIMHESNSFHTVKTALSDFRVLRGEEIARELGPSTHEVAGYLEGAKRFDFEPALLMFTTATPAGPVTNEAFDILTAELVQRLKSAGNVDGVLLALHGAMVTETHPETPKSSGGFAEPWGRQCPWWSLTISTPTYRPKL